MCEENLEHEEQPRFLLPPGCSDLIDAFGFKPKKPEATPILPSENVKPAHERPAVVTVTDPILLCDLAKAMDIKPHYLVYALLESNIFAALYTSLDFATASAACACYGVTARKIA